MQIHPRYLVYLNYYSFSDGNFSDEHGIAVVVSILGALDVGGKRWHAQLAFHCEGAHRQKSTWPFMTEARAAARGCYSWLLGFDINSVLVPMLAPESESRSAITIYKQTGPDKHCYCCCCYAVSRCCANGSCVS